LGRLELVKVKHVANEPCKRRWCVRTAALAAREKIFSEGHPAVHRPVRPIFGVSVSPSYQNSFTGGMEAAGGKS